jgi:hypothetical protein
MLTMAMLLMMQAAAPAARPLDLAALRLGLAGGWEGKLEYRDYQSNRWFPLPVKVRVEDGGDGVTLLRKADFDDGPARGNVRIITASMLGPDGATEYNGTFRAGRAADLATSRLTLSAPAADATHWVMVAVREDRDDDRPARIRETSTRNGDTLVTLKEVDFTDDAAETWLVRNRTTLRRVGD